MATIHATAVVDPSAKLGTGVEIGPFCVIGPDVELGEGTKVHSHAAITGRTRLGAGCQVFSFASIGQWAVEKYRGEPSTLTIGAHDDPRARHHQSWHQERHRRQRSAPTACDDGAHVAHDCTLATTSRGQRRDPRGPRVDR
jgi:UDP-N-acetylglucosamine acyltransferase